MRLLAAFAAAPALRVLLVLLATSSTVIAQDAERPDGLKIEVTKAATCTRKTQVGDFIGVDYKGSLQDGTVFDSSYSRNRPFQFTLGKGEVITGWDEGLLDMCIGEARRLTIPPELAYGNRNLGAIPAGSTLIFETELKGIKGVAAEPQPAETSTAPSSTAADVATSTASPAEASNTAGNTASPTAEEAVATSTAAGSEGGPKDGYQVPEENQCRLFGPFALFIQGGLGAAALLTLVFKRWRETPRRPLKIWSFDVSKQVIGSLLTHALNLLISEVSSSNAAAKAAEAAKAATFVQDDGARRSPNPCSFYLLNLAIDTTVGIPVLVLLLRLLHHAFLLTPLATPPESIRTGNYGQPPKTKWYLKQLMIYCIGLVGMKLFVYILFLLLPWLYWVGDWALRWTEGNEVLQITFAMLVFPLIMNAIQYWVIDNFIKDPAGGQGHQKLQDDEDDGEERRPFVVDDDEDDEEEEDRKHEDRVQGKEVLKEANPTPVPVGDGGDSVDEEDRHASSSSSRIAKDR